MIGARAALGLLKEAFADWREDKASRLAAALAYYTVFSIVPLLIIVIGIAGIVFGREAAQGRVVGELQGLVGSEGARMLQEAVENAGRGEGGIAATLLGLGALILGATGVFGQLQDGLNTIWEVAPKPGRGWRRMLEARFVSFTMVLGIGFLLLVSLALSAGLAALGDVAAGLLPASPVLLGTVHVLVSFGVITLLFAMIYKVLPDVEIAWSDVGLGAAATALLFTAGKVLLGLYLGRGAGASAFGAAAGLVILLLWVYYSAQILFFGAELTQVYANRYGSRIVPDEDAVAVTEEARAQQGMPSEEQVREAPGATRERSTRVKAGSSGESRPTWMSGSRAAPAARSRNETRMAVSSEAVGSRPVGDLRDLKLDGTTAAALAVLGAAMLAGLLRRDPAERVLPFRR